MQMKYLVLALTLLLVPGLAIASDYSAFQKDIMAPYGLYKKSLALTSQAKNKEKAEVVVDKFIKSWQGLAHKYANDVPDRLDQTTDFSRKINGPVQVGQEALTLLQAGNVRAAHAYLEKVRYALWRMRVDAGISSLNGKVNSFHEAMEIVLDGMASDSSTEHLKHLGNRYGSWLSIKWAAVGSAKDSVADKESFAGMIKHGDKAIAALITELKKGDAAAAQKAGGKVKKSYKGIFFLPECS